MNPLYVGIDVSSRNNVVFFMKPNGSKIKNFTVPNSKDGARKLVKEMLAALSVFLLQISSSAWKLPLSTEIIWFTS